MPAIVLFDIDGTLMRGAGPQHKEALISGIRQVTGLETTLDGIDTAGRLDRDLIRVMLQARGFNRTQIRRALADIVLACQECYGTNCPTDLSSIVCAGVPQLLTELHRRGAILALVTGNLSRIGWRKVELAGLRHFFSAGAFAEDGSSRTVLAKIAARRAAKAAGLKGASLKSARISLIGDHMNDIIAAKANGFYSVAVNTGPAPFEALEKAGPDRLVRNLFELDPATLLY